MRLPALLAERVRAVVSDQRIGHCNDLTSIRGVGEDLLISSHGSVETNFADLRSLCAKAFAFENPTIFEGEKRMHRETVSSFRRMRKRNYNFSEIWRAIRGKKTRTARAVRALKILPHKCPSAGSPVPWRTRSNNRRKVV